MDPRNSKGWRLSKLNRLEYGTDAEDLMRFVNLRWMDSIKSIR